MKKRIILLCMSLLTFVAVFAFASNSTYAASPKLPRAKITHIASYDWYDFEDTIEEEGLNEPEYIYYNDGSYTDQYGDYVKEIYVQCRKEKGNVKYQFALRVEGHKKWEKYTNGKNTGMYFYDYPKNKTVYLKVRTYKDINGKRYFGKWSPIVKESTHDKEVHIKTIYTKNQYVKGYIKGAFKGEKIRVEAGKGKYTVTVKKTAKKYPYKIYIGNHDPGITIKIKLLSSTDDVLFTYTNKHSYYAPKIAKGYTKKQVKYTRYWGSPSSTANSSNGYSYWFYDDGSEVDFINGRVYWWYYVD